MFVYVAKVFIYVAKGGHICDPFWENLPILAETTIEKVGNNFILNKYIYSQFPIIALPLYEVSKRLVAPALQACCLNSAFFCSPSRGNGNFVKSK